MSKAIFKKVATKILLIFIFVFIYKIGLSFQLQSPNGVSESDTASVPKEIEDAQNIGINKDASNATLMPYGSMKEALAANCHASSFSRSLNGISNPVI